MVAGYVKELNAKLNRWETIKKFTILPRDLTIEDGELTPSLKIKRRGVETNFAAEIEKMYAGTPRRDVAGCRPRRRQFTAVRHGPARLRAVKLPRRPALVGHRRWPLALPSPCCRTERRDL